MSEPRDPPVEGEWPVMSSRLQAHDWSRTTLGQPHTWGRSLLSYVTMVLDLPTPALLLWGAEQTQVYNEGYAALLGSGRHPRCFGGTYEACWPDLYPQLSPWLQRVLAQGQTAHLERQPVTLDRHGFAEEAYFHFTFSPLRDERGAVVGIFQPFQEVTDRVLAERREQTLRALRPQAASVDEAMAASAQALGGAKHDVAFARVYAAGEAAGTLRLVASVGIEEAAAGRLDELAREVFAEERTREVHDLEARWGVQHHGVWPEPTRSALALPLRSAGVTLGVVVLGSSPRLPLDASYLAFFEDVARELAMQLEEARRAESARRTEQAHEGERQRLRALFESAPVAIAIWEGEQFLYTLTNALHRKALGGRNLIGQPLFEVSPGLLDHPVGAALRRVRETGQPESIVQQRFDLPDAHGVTRELFFNTSLAPTTSPDGSQRGVMAVSLDVTEEKQAQGRVGQALAEAERASRTKDEFLSMLGHELRNPLSPILTALHLMRQRGDDAFRKEHDIIDRQARHLLRLVDDLLDISRITRGKVELKRSHVEASEVTARAIELVNPLLDLRSHQLSVEVPPEGLILDADPSRLTQVLANLLTNAAKYTPRRGHIQLRAVREGAWIELRVRDNGMGIDPALRPHLFEKFAQHKQAIDRSQGGLGLGLAIVRNLVELHGGSVEAHSEGRDQGSEFVVRLPAATSPADASVEAAAPTGAPATAGERVLLVDDNVDAAELMGEALRGMGYTFRIAHDGLAALHIARDFAPTLVLLDIGLPVLDGYEVARRLRKLPGGERLRLVALTGYGQAADKARALVAGFDAHLIKPVDPERLHALLASFGPRPG